jgi:hypothetical protein
VVGVAAATTKQTQKQQQQHNVPKLVKTSHEGKVKNHLDATKYAVLLPQHVSGTNIPIIRSTTSEYLLFLGGHTWKAAWLCRTGLLGVNTVRSSAKHIH